MEIQIDRKKQKIWFLLRWIPAILMLTFIFTMSAKNAEESSEESNSVSQVIVEVATFMRIAPPDLDEATLDKINDTVRELAHFTEYFILGLTLFLAAGVKISEQNVTSKIEEDATEKTEAGNNARSERLRIAGLVIFAVCYAISDEVHQYFVPGRCFQIQDIVVDSLGATVGILLCYITKHKFVK